MSALYDSTTTPRKLEIDKLLNDHSIIPSHRNESVALVGCFDGLLRHIHNKEELGFLPSQMVFVEIKRYMFNQLVFEKSRLCKEYPQYKDIRIYCDDIFNHIHSGVTHIDLDFNTSLSYRTTKCILKAFKCRIPNIQIVICSRYSFWRQNSGMEILYPGRENKWGQPITPKECLKLLYRQKWSRYYDRSIEQSYGGVNGAPMHSAVFNQKA